MVTAQELRKTTNENYGKEIQRIVDLELMQIEKEARKAKGSRDQKYSRG